MITLLFVGLILLGIAAMIGGLLYLIAVGMSDGPSEGGGGGCILMAAGAIASAIGIVAVIARLIS